MRFRYAFQKIVDLKANEKMQAEWGLTEAIGRMKSEEATLSELKEAKLEIQEELHKQSAQPTTISNLLMFQSFVEHIEGRIQSKHQDVLQAKAVVQVKQEDLNGKVLEEKVWNKAREKALNSFTSQMLKKEQEQLDEMATNRYKRLS